MEGFEKIDDVIAAAVKDQQNAAWLFAEVFLIFRVNRTSISWVFGSFLFSGIWLCDLLTSGNAVDGLRISGTVRNISTDRLR